MTRPKSSRLRLAAADRRVEILKAARTAFAKGGLAGTRTRDIAAEAGVNEALLYQHFSSKEEMFEAAVIQPLEEVVNEGVRLAREQLPVEPREQLPVEPWEPVARERTARFIAELLTVTIDILPLLGVALFADANRGSETYQRQLLPALTELAEGIGEFLGEWGQRGLDTALVTRAVVGMCLGIALDHRLGNEPLDDIPAVAEQLTDLIIDGVAPRDPATPRH